MKTNAIKFLSLMLVTFMVFCCFAACKPSKNEEKETISGDVTDEEATSNQETEEQTSDIESDTSEESLSEDTEADTESEGSVSEDTEADTESVSEDTETVDDGLETDEDGYVLDSLPESYDWGGVEFRILQWQQGHDFVVGAEANTSTINRVKFQSQKAVESRFKVKIKVKEVSDGWGQSEITSELEASVLSNYGTYDMVSNYTDSAGKSITNGYCIKLNDLEYIDFEMPWWPKHLLESATIGENIYYAGGDINGENMMRNMCVTYVNLDMYKNYHMENLVGGRSIFEVVDDGDWTIEVFKKMALGSMDNEDDIYGLAFRDGEYFDAFLYSGGFTMIKTVNGVLCLDENLQSAKMQKWVTECQELLSQTHVDTKMDIGAFKDGRSLFGGDETLTTAEEMSGEGKVNFSVLPMPKYDSDQEHYYTCEGVSSSLITVPADIKDSERVGMIVEGLASSNHRVVKDVVYYDVFQIRYSAAESADGARMFDILYNSIVFDIGRVFTHNWGNSFTFRHVVADATANWASTYEEQNGYWIQGINDLYVALG